MDGRRATEDVSVSNIFRTRSVASRLSSTTSNIPMIDGTQLDSQPPHWTIHVGLAEVPSVPLLQGDDDDVDTITEARVSHNTVLHEDVSEALTASRVPPLSSTDAPVQPPPRPTRSTGSFTSKEGLRLPRGTSDGHSILGKTLSNSTSAGLAAGTTSRWQSVGVDVYSLGSFAFKGMAGQWEIAQVLPSPLAARLELFSHVLKRGKATCTRQDDKQLHSVKMRLPDISGLVLAR